MYRNGGRAMCGDPQHRKSLADLRFIKEEQ